MTAKFDPLLPTIPFAEWKQQVLEQLTEPESEWADDGFSLRECWDAGWGVAETVSEIKEGFEAYSEDDPCGGRACDECEIGGCEHAG